MVKQSIKDWGMNSSDLDCHLGGTIIAWSPSLNLISVKRFRIVMGIELEDSETGKHFMVLNIYGPFYDRKTFWERLESSGALDFPHLIIGGYLNLTLPRNEAWGKNTRLDSLGPFFRHIF